MTEHSRIARFFAPLAAGEAGSFGLHDDAAILSPPQGQSLVITTDSVIEGIHVLHHATPQQFAQKLVRRNMSDLAAMGATPWRYTLNLHTPHGLAEDWFAEFSATLAREQQHFSMVLVGGDSTSGASAIHTTLTCFGVIDDTPLRRNGAAAGEDIYVSGSLGGAAYALALLQQSTPSAHGTGDGIDPSLTALYHCPEPRLTLGKMLRGMATSALDISDGLLADMQQICDASHCGAVLMRDAIPLCLHLKNAALNAAQKYRLALSGGDDYELCFTAPAALRGRIAELASTLALPLTRIGHIAEGNGVRVLDENGNPLPVDHTGWAHQ